MSIVRHWFSAKPTNLLLLSPLSGLRSNKAGDHDIILLVVIVLLLHILVGRVLRALK
jgi:hypothetical protein